MHILQKHLEEIPWPIKVTLIVGGALMSAFSSQYWEWLQWLGATAGAVIAGVGVCATFWHWINLWRAHQGKPRLELNPSHLIIAVLIVALGFALWQPRGLAVANPKNTHVDITAVHPLTQDEEKALRGLSEIINTKGRAAAKLAEELVRYTNPLGGGGTEYQNLPLVRDKAQDVSNAVEVLHTDIYREFLPAHTLDAAELVTALGTPTANVVESPTYIFGQKIGDYIGSLNTANLIAATAKNEQISGMLLNTTNSSRRQFEAGTSDFKKWIDSFNERVAARRLVK